MLALRGRRYRVEELAFSHCGRWLAAGGNYRGGIHVWDTANPTAKPLQPAVEDDFWLTRLTFRPDGRLYFVCRDKWFLYNPATNELTKLTRPTAQGRFIPAPDATWAVRTGSHLKLERWTIPTAGKPVRQWTAKGSSWEYDATAFARDGTALATCAMHKNQWVVIVRDATTGETRAELTTPAVYATQLAFAPGGEYLVGRYAASLVRWALAEPDAALRKVQNPGRKHFQAMTVHPAGPLLTVDNDRLVRVWSIPTLTPDRAIEWSIGKLYAVAVSPDGTRAAVGSHTGKVLVWDWD